MGYTSIRNSADFSEPVETLWAAFVDPALTGRYAEHQTRFVPAEGFHLAPGQRWAEHHGEECDFDVVTWTITAYEPLRRMEFRGKQRGILQRITLTLEPSDGGSRLTEVTRFSPAVAGAFGVSALSWLLLLTGLLARVGDDKGSDLERLRDFLQQDG